MRFRAIIFPLFFMLAMFTPYAISADAWPPADREPTAEEILILEYINRFRADPAAEAERIAPGGSGHVNGYISDGIDWAMFRAEMKALKPAPPLVMNLDLLDAARKHSHYMILNELTHAEDPGRPGFVAQNFGERLKLVGYHMNAAGEDCFRDAQNVPESHAGFVIDFGGGPGNMQPGRGHRTNMANPDYRELGCGALAHGEHLSVTHELGNRKARRLAGGVVYFDKNENNFYDAGEGIGGVVIKSSDGTSTATWKSGGFALELKSNASVTLTAEYLGEKFSKTFDAGKENIKFDWIAPKKLAAKR